MAETQIIYRHPSELSALEGNPRTITDADFRKLEASVKKFGILPARPFILSKRGKKLVVIGGNQRLKVATKLGLESVPTVLLEGLTEDQEREIIIRDNVSNGEWDVAQLQNDWVKSDLENWGVNCDFWEGAGAGGDGSGDGEQKYTTKVEVPHYTPTGERPEVSELVDVSKAEALIADIEKAELPDDARVFLKAAAMRFAKFDYQKIAEWYAHADKPTQGLMEKLALVIIDYDKAIENGLVQVSKQLNDIASSQNEDDDQ